MNETSIDKLILSGALEPSAIDNETGEMLYQFTEKLEEIDPELHNRLTTAVMRMTMQLWELGFVNIDLTDEDPIISLTKKAFDKNETVKLDEDLRRFLEDAKEGMRQ